MSSRPAFDFPVKSPGFFTDRLHEADPAIAEAIDLELRRQQEKIELGSRRSDANGSSAGPCADHHRWVSTTKPLAVSTNVDRSWGVWPGVATRRTDAATSNSSS